MKKIKFLLFVLFAFALISIPMSSLASPCCDLWLNSITQSEDGMITVDYAALNPLPNREVRITVATANYVSGRQLYEDFFYISNDSFDGEDTVYTFDGSFLAKGETYRINLSYTYCCENEYCSYISVEKTFTTTAGIPILDFKDIPDGMLELIGQSKVIVKFSANVSGMYNLSIYSEDDVDVEKYQGNSSFGVSYFSAGETVMYEISNINGDELCCEVYFEKLEENIVSPEITNPSHNDVCFRLSQVRGLNKITISKSGIYRIDVTDDNDYLYYDVIDENGDAAGIGLMGDGSEIYLGEGSYFIDTTELTDKYVMTVTYVVPQEISFGTVYTPQLDEYAKNISYYKMTLSKPSVVTVSNEQEIVFCLYKDEYDDFIYGEQTKILDAGEYYVCMLNQRSYGAQVTINKVDLESVALDTPFTPESYDNYYYYFAFCAPKSGKYEFDFSKYGNYYWFNESGNGYSTDYHTLELNKDEWVLVGMYSEAEVKISEYIAPEPIKLEYEETEYFDYVPGKTIIFSFTPDEDGFYKLYTEYTYATHIKVWTDNNVLYETEDNSYYSFDRNFELTKNVTVYVSFGGGGYNYGESSITFKSPYTEIKDETSVSLSAESDIIAYFSAEKSGFYKFTFSRSNGSTEDAIVEIKGNVYHVYNDYYKNVVVYLEEDEKLFITFKKFNDSWLPDVYVYVLNPQVTELKKDTSYTPQIGNYYSFIPDKTAVYKAVFPADFRLNVSFGDKEYISFGEYNEQYFVGEEGKQYLLYVSENYYVSDDYNTSYTDMRITEENSLSVNIGETYKTKDSFEILTFNVEEDGLYRIENDICNTRAYIFYDGGWTSVAGTYSSLFNLKKGFYVIIVQPKDIFAYDTPVAMDDIDNPYAQFKIYKTQDTKEISVSLVDAYASPSGGAVTLLMCITSPADVLDFEYGVEYQNGSGQTIRQICGYESMYASDMRYVLIDPYFADWEMGDTVTIRPFAYVGYNENDVVYGEQKTVTFNLRSDITHLDYNETKVSVKSYDEYNYFYKDYWYSFTQPLTDGNETYIETTSVIADFDLFDEDYYYVGSCRDAEYGYEYYELEPGKVYYLRCRTRFEDSDAYIWISSLPEACDANDVLKDVVVDNGKVTFTVSTDKNCKAYIAAYNSRGGLVDIKSVTNPKGTYSVAFAKDKIVRYKVMVVDSNNNPLCSSVDR